MIPKKSSYYLITYIKKNVGSVYNNKSNILDIFVFQLLIVMDPAFRNDNCTSYVKYLGKAKQSVTKINQAINKNFQTDNIQAMHNLKYILFSPYTLNYFSMFKFLTMIKNVHALIRKVRTFLSATSVFIMKWIKSILQFITIMLSYGPY